MKFYFQTANHQKKNGIKRWKRTRYGNGGQKRFYNHRIGDVEFMCASVFGLSENPLLCGTASDTI